MTWAWAMRKAKRQTKPTPGPRSPVLDFEKIQRALDDREGFQAWLKKQQAKERKLPGKIVSSLGD